jgi:hypothetical protein
LVLITAAVCLYQVTVLAAMGHVVTNRGEIKIANYDAEAWILGLDDSVLAGPHKSVNVKSGPTYISFQYEVTIQEAASGPEPIGEGAEGPESELPAAEGGEGEPSEPAEHNEPAEPAVPSVPAEPSVPGEPGEGGEGGAEGEELEITPMRDMKPVVFILKINGGSNAQVGFKYKLDLAVYLGMSITIEPIGGLSTDADGYYRLAFGTEHRFKVTVTGTVKQTGTVDVRIYHQFLYYEE